MANADTVLIRRRLRNVLAMVLMSPLATVLVVGLIATLLLPDQRADTAEYWTVFSSSAYFYITLQIVSRSAKLTKDLSIIACYVFFAAGAFVLLACSGYFVWAIQRRGGSEFQAILPMVFAMQTVAVLAHAYLRDARESAGEAESQTRSSLQPS